MGNGRLQMCARGRERETGERERRARKRERRKRDCNVMEERERGKGANCKDSLRSFSFRALISRQKIPHRGNKTQGDGAYRARRIALRTSN